MAGIPRVKAGARHWPGFVAGQPIHEPNDRPTMPLPNPGDTAAVFAYAMSFNAYDVYGSVDAAAKIARDASRSTLEEVRAELFFKARASRHAGNDAYLDTYKELLPLLERYSKAAPA